MKQFPGQKLFVHVTYPMPMAEICEHLFTKFYNSSVYTSSTVYMLVVWTLTKEIPGSNVLRTMVFITRHQVKWVQKLRHIALTFAERC